MEPESAVNFTLIEASLWMDNPRQPNDLTWLDWSWKEPVHFWKTLHAHWERLQASQSKSIPLVRYNFYHDWVARQKDPMTPALIWFDGATWRTCTYAGLKQIVDGLSATWEGVGVQPGETLAILLPQGQNWLAALLAGFRLGLVVSLIPPQGDAFVQRRLKNLQPQWLAMDPLYRHRLAADWQERILPLTLSPLPPSGRPYEYPGKAVVAQCLDPTSTTPDWPCPVDADTLYLGALRDGVLALGIKPGQTCAAPGWHPLQNQPSMALAILLSGATWVHIDFAAIENDLERLSQQRIDIMGVCRSLRDLLQQHPPSGAEAWRQWFRDPAESPDLTLWQEFIEHRQLKESHSVNLAWNAALGGAVLFSSKHRGLAHHYALPAAGANWQLGMVASPDLPSLENMGRVALGRQDEKGETAWIATPHVLAPYRNGWNYLGTYPRGRAGRTFPRQEVLELLARRQCYLALVEAPSGDSDGDIRYVLLVFGEGVDVAALQACIKSELGGEFLPDRIECLPLLPKRNEEGGADQAWCQFHYLTGELYRRQRSAIYRCLSELKRKVLA